MRTLILISLAAHLTLPLATDLPELNQLDECIQRRFFDRNAFGMERMAPLRVHGVRQFRPENVTEQRVVDQLEQEGYQVALFLAGRNVNATFRPESLLPQFRYGVQGPAQITRLRNPEELPRPETLLEESRTAIATFATRPGYEVQKGDWTVALRPLRATNEACVQCHNASGAQVKMGDTLGVVMYAYKHT